MQKEDSTIFNNYTDFAVGSGVVPNCRNKLINRAGCFIFSCLEGRAVLSVNFRKFGLKKGDFMIVYSDTYPMFVQTSPGFSLSYCILSPEFSYEAAHPVSIEFLDFLFDHPVFLIPNNKKDILEQWWQLIFYYDDMDNHQKRLLVRNHIQNLLISLDGGVAPIMQKQNEVTNSRSQVIFAKFYQLIWKHYREHHDVYFYADKLCITPYYLSRITNGIVGQSPKKLIDYYIILEMKMVLETSDITINELAEKFYFEDASYMCRYFKRQTGVSLSGYRKR